MLENELHYTNADEFFPPKIRIIQFDHNCLGQDNLGKCMTKVKIVKKDAVVSIGLADEINSLKLS